MSDDSLGESTRTERWRRGAANVFCGRARSVRDGADESDVGGGGRVGREFRQSGSTLGGSTVRITLDATRLERGGVGSDSCS
jgi:hypothetical protein